MRVFIGYDPRQPVAASVLAHSIAERSSQPVQIIQLRLKQLPIKRRGLTDFTYSRFLVPYLCGFRGKALFLDADMLCLGDIAELFAYSDPDHAVRVVKGKQRFEWASLMLFNNERCRALTPEHVETSPSLFSMDWGSVGDLPKEWNHCIGYDEPNPAAKLVHFTMGIPVWAETIECEYSTHWQQELNDCSRTVSWLELMGNSVHADKLHQLALGPN